MGDRLPKFDEAGNMILKKHEPESTPEDVNEFWVCQYCDSEWKSKISRDRHEAWCKKNPNRRTYKKPISEGSEVKKPKKKTPVKLKTKPKDIIKELREFDKTFGLTDEQIVKYIRGLIK